MSWERVLLFCNIGLCKSCNDSFSPDTIYNRGKYAGVRLPSQKVGVQHPLAGRHLITFTMVMKGADNSIMALRGLSSTMYSSKSSHSTFGGKFLLAKCDIFWCSTLFVVLVSVLFACLSLGSGGRHCILLLFYL